jgi:hypothetical protein
MLTRLIAAAVSPIILAILVPFGINENTPVGEAIVLLLTGLGTAAAVYFASRK